MGIAQLTLPIQSNSIRSIRPNVLPITNFISGFSWYVADRNLNPHKGIHTPMHLTISSLILSVLWSELMRLFDNFLSPLRHSRISRPQPTMATVNRVMVLNTLMMNLPASFGGQPQVVYCRQEASHVKKSYCRPVQHVHRPSVAFPCRPGFASH